ncbi:MAG: cell division protein FtsK [Actinobacteria bacterium]|nr:cell division protein FtsK [Actinomycetota bacterium]
MRWPHVDAATLSLWQPIPVGVDDDGEVDLIHLPERNVLIGGEPGAGKSVALSMIVATAALDPNVRLWLLDGKQVELASWSPMAERSVGPSIEEAISVLRDLQREMDARYTALLEVGLRKVEPGIGMPMHLVVCDELAFYLTVSDRKPRGEFGDLMRDLVSRGRAAGIVVVAATQKPSHDIIPTSLRDLFGFRWALRCNTPQASDTILGAGWASQGFDASSVAGFQRGVGFLLAEESSPRRLLSYYLSDDDLEDLARRAQVTRAGIGGGDVAA